jgi:hypothetical protein
MTLKLLSQCIIIIGEFEKLKFVTNTKKKLRKKVDERSGQPKLTAGSFVPKVSSVLKEELNKLLFQTMVHKYLPFPFLDVYLKQICFRPILSHVPPSRTTCLAAYFLNFTRKPNKKFCIYYLIKSNFGRTVFDSIAIISMSPIDF